MVVAVGVILIAATWSATTRSASATTRCDDEHPDVPAVVQCRRGVTSLAGRTVAIVNLGRWVSRLDGRERLEDLVGVQSVPWDDPAVAWLQ
jgi:hypothetical protein